LRLGELAAQWSRSRDRRFLPSLPENLSICWGVPAARRSPEQQALLRAATRFHGLTWGAALAAALLVGLTVDFYTSSVRRAARAERARDLVGAVLRAPADDVPRAIEDLGPYRDLAVGVLHTYYTDASKPSYRLRAAVALAALEKPDGDFLVESLRSAPASEWHTILLALRSDRESAAGKLWDRFGRERERAMRVRWATVLLHLGDPRAARQVLAPAPDPTARTEFIEGFGQWRGDLAALPALLRTTGDVPLRVGLCAALGRLNPDSLAEDTRQRLQEALLELYRSAPDGGTHSAAGWALRQWHQDLPALAPSDRPTPDRQWFVNGQGMTMLGVPPGAFTEGDVAVPEWAAAIASVHPSLLARVPPHQVTLTHRWFLCDREVSMALYQQFIDDRTLPEADRPPRWDPDRAISPTGDCPAHMVSWVDAIQFCNWLSRRERRRPCYERSGTKWRARSGTRTVEVEGWRCNFDADGYRLPTEAEWEYACRAGTQTWWCSGDEDTPLADSAVFHQLRTAPCGSKMPNLWGLFDMHGNVREWCWDAFHEYPRDPVSDPTGSAEPPPFTDRVHRGGSWYDQPAACRSAFRNRSPLVLRDKVIGFRVACGSPPAGQDGPGR
jgi:formylglycine-generating enzyme required for sulfatase activity